MKNGLLLFVILLFSANQSFAAFPIRQQNIVVAKINEQPQIKYEILPSIVNPKASDNDEKSETGTMSVLALVCGILSAVLTFAIGFKGDSNVAALIAGGILGLAAIGFANVGADRKLKFFAYTGAILGTVSVVPVLIYAMGVLFIAWVSGEL